MRRALLTFGFVLVGTVVLYAATHITTGAATPAVCNAGDIFYKTGASAGLHACSAANTWTRVAFGTTDISSPTDDSLMLGNGTAWQTKAVADCDDTVGKHLNYDTATNAFSCGTSASGGSGTVTHTGALTAEQLVVGNGTDDVKTLAGLTDDSVIVANGTAWQLKAIADCDDSAGNHLNYDTATNAFSCGTTGPAGAAGALSGLSAATGANTIASGNNHSQIWNWALTTDSISAMTFGETTAATGGGTDTQTILALNTLATSTAVPLIINNFGAKNALRINDVAADATPLVVNADGDLCLKQATCANDLTITETTGGRAVLIAGAAATFVIDASFDANCVACFGTTSAHTAGLLANNAPRLIAGTAGRIAITKDGSTTISNANMLLALDSASFTLNEYRLIGIGYKNSQTHLPVAIGAELMATSGNRGLWDFVVLTSSSNSDVAPAVKLRVDNQGTLVLPSTTPTPAVSDTSASSCGTTAATIAGNNNIGTVTVGATSGTDCTLTFTTTAPVEWICMANDQTTVTPVQAIPTSTTTARLVGLFTAADKLNYVCFPR